MAFFLFFGGDNMAKKGLKQKHIGKGRNDLCPCGSGLKYKKCCKPVPRMKTDEEQKADEERRKKSSGVSPSELAQFIHMMARTNVHSKSTINYGDLPGRVTIDER